jgi:hypothetical protein
MAYASAWSNFRRHECACGWAQCWGGPIEEVRPGDLAWIPPGEKHWRCADDGGHQEKKDGKVVDWMEQVSDDQFQAL